VGSPYATSCVNNGNLPILHHLGDFAPFLTMWWIIGIFCQYRECLFNVLIWGEPICSGWRNSASRNYHMVQSIFWYFEQFRWRWLVWQTDRFTHGICCASLCCKPKNL